MQSKKNKQLQKLNEGDELDGWTLTNIQPERVSLEKGTEVKQLELMVKGSPVKIDANHKSDNEKKDVVEAVSPTKKEKDTDQNTQTSPITSTKPDN